MGDKGIVASTAGLAILLNEGIGDTIRVSLTPEPGAPREREVEVAQQVLQSLGLRSFLPQVSACPGCGRTTSTFFQEMAQQIQGYLKDADAGLARDASRRRGAARRGHGLRRQRARRDASTPTSGSACRARSRSRSPRSSSTAASIGRCAATGSSTSSSTSSRTTSAQAIPADGPTARPPSAALTARAHERLDGQITARRSMQAARGGHERPDRGRSPDCSHSLPCPDACQSHRHSATDAALRGAGRLSRPRSRVYTSGN